MIMAPEPHYGRCDKFIGGTLKFTLGLICFLSLLSGCSSSFDSGGNTIPGANSNPPATGGPESGQTCPAPIGSYTGTWSNGATDVSSLTAISIANGVITLLRTPCGQVSPGSITVLSDGSFSYSRPEISVQGQITSSGGLNGTISNSSNCSSPVSWSLNKFSNDTRGLLTFVKIMPVNSSPKYFTSTPSGLIDSAVSAFGLFPVGSRITLHASGGVVSTWGGGVGCASGASSCDYYVSPGSIQIQIMIQ